MARALLRYFWVMQVCCLLLVAGGCTTTGELPWNSLTLITAFDGDEVRCQLHPDLEFARGGKTDSPMWKGSSLEDAARFAVKNGTEYVYWREVIGDDLRPTEFTLPDDRAVIDRAKEVFLRHGVELCIVTTLVHFYSPSGK